jgi:hypothetical protein
MDIKSALTYRLALLLKLLLGDFLFVVEVVVVLEDEELISYLC